MVDIDKGEPNENHAHEKQIYRDHRCSTASSLVLSVVGGGRGTVGFGHSPKPGSPEAAAPHAVGDTAQQHAEQETKETQVSEKNHNVVNAYERI